MKKNIIKLLEKYEDEIMKNTLGDSIDECDERYADVYKWEWREHKEQIASSLAEIKDYVSNLDVMGFVYIIISEWRGVMTFDEGDLDIEGLKEVCQKILNEL